MQTSITPSKKSYTVPNSRRINTEQDLINLFDEYIRTESTADKSQIEKISESLNKPKNHVLQFDPSGETIQEYLEEGERVAYGVIRHIAPVHDVQTLWSYKFTVINNGNEYYMSCTRYGWTPDTDLDDKMRLLF